MSGAGGGGGFGAPAGTCDTLVIDTLLSSPKPDVVALIEVGDVLDVTLADESGTTTVVVTKDGAVAGGLAAPMLPRLRQCMLEGTEYAAKVTAKKDALVRVRVSAVHL
jgi:hypothetical protein